MFPLLCALPPVLAQGADLFIETRRMLPDVPIAGVRELLAGDVDGDGWSDVLQLTSGLDKLLLSLGYGGFVEDPGALPPLADDTWTGALADFDGDADLDAYLGNRGAPARLYENLGGAFVHALDLAGGTNKVTGCAAGDVDGDGDQDLLVTNEGSVQLFRNGGAGLSLSLDPSFPALTGTYADVELGDVDADGDLDAVAGVFCGDDSTFCSGKLTLFRNGGAGDFAAVSSSGLGELGYRLSLADAIQDGDVDVFASVRATLEIDQLYFNNGTGAFVPAVLPSAIPSTDHVFADLDGDGLADVSAANKTDVVRLKGAAAGLFVDVPPGQSPGPGEILVFDDFDGDGDKDVCGSLAGLPGLWLSDAAGHFAAVHAPPYRLGGLAVEGTATGDVDGDALPDLLVTTLDEIRRCQPGWPRGPGPHEGPGGAPVSADGRLDLGLRRITFDEDGYTAGLGDGSFARHSEYQKGFGDARPPGRFTAGCPDLAGRGPELLLRAASVPEVAQA